MPFRAAAIEKVCSIEVASRSSSGRERVSSAGRGKGLRSEKPITPDSIRPERTRMPESLERRIEPSRLISCSGSAARIESAATPP